MKEITLPIKSLKDVEKVKELLSNGWKIAKDGWSIAKEKTTITLIKGFANS